jgi:hypothetical protein
MVPAFIREETLKKGPFIIYLRPFKGLRLFARFQT